MGLFASGVGSVAFRFRAVLNFSVAFLMMAFAFLYPNKYPLVFFIHATAKQSLSRQICRLPMSQVIAVVNS